MKKLRILFLLLAMLGGMLLGSNKVCADFYWKNDLSTLFKSNKATIYELNIRTFGAKDKNDDGIIDETKGETRGTFLNAIPYLDDLVKLGVNTIHLLPITPVGKTKALGTAGSLYAAASFNEINPQFVDKDTSMPLEDQARKYILECHKRKIRVIVDLPACGSYDLYMQHPEYFAKDKNGNSIIPSDWTDVRLLNSGTQNEINQDTYNLYAEFIDMMFDIGADGVRADVAELKTPLFWKKLISETKSRDSQFLFLAEVYTKQGERPSEFAPFTSYEKLLEAGFDGFYSDFSEIKNWKTPRDLYNCVSSNMAFLRKSNYQKSVISDFTTHDEVSPILTHGSQYSIMMAWLSATLPFNQYFTDGFSTGDNYIYRWANKKADISFTDDDYYFAHRGKLDIFNFSRKPYGGNQEILNNMFFAQRFRSMSGEAMYKGSFKPLRTSNAHVFAYKREFNKAKIIVIGNFDFENPAIKVKTYVSGVNRNLSSIPIKALDMPLINNGKIISNLLPGEIQVIYFEPLKKDDAK